MLQIWAHSLFPKALKSCPKSKNCPICSHCLPLNRHARDGLQFPAETFDPGTSSQEAGCCCQRGPRFRQICARNFFEDFSGWYYWRALDAGGWQRSTPRSVWKLRSTKNIYANFCRLTLSLLDYPENTHHRAVQLVSILTVFSAALLHTNNNIFSCLVESKPVKLDTGCTVILPPVVSVL